METDSNEMNMESADLTPTEWLDEFIIISREEMESEIAADKELDESMEMDYDGKDEDDDDFDSDSDSDSDSDDYQDFEVDDDADDEEYKKRLNLRLIRMSPLFLSQPRLKKICEDWTNHFLPTCFKKYKFNSDKNNSVNEIHEKANDLKYLVNLCGTNLTRLNVKKYPISQIMPIINANCPNLESLSLGFKEIMSQDFENCFSNMNHLKRLSIEWQCENSTLPMTLAKSLEHVGGTLKALYLSCTLKKNDMFSPDSLASVFPRLIALEHLNIYDFGLSQFLLQSIGEMENLVNIMLISHQPKNHPMFDTAINMYPIGNLINLKMIYISCDYGITDEFLINLSNNARKLTYLKIIGPNITDTGISAINNLEELKEFDLGLGYCQLNQFITDESIQCLFNPKLGFLNISNCINITDNSVLKLVENLPNLTGLSINNTKITCETVEEIRELGKQRQKPLKVNYFPFENDDWLFSNH